jgi:metal-responsive CopG/Arc/MetJ family transcriptional regulator
MKKKLSLTLDDSLLTFVDSESGASRSEKIETIVRRYRDARRDAELRRQLAALNPSADDDAESEAWSKVMEASQWSESGAVTSGRSRSPRSRSRGRR